MIQFPVIHRFAISGYQLFPGKDGTGIDRTLVPGVTVVVGINGLGKTTLLNAIFRALSGPVEWKDRRVDQPAGSTPTELGEWKNRQYFRKRVSDEAAAANIDLRLAFGDEFIELRRSLRNLALTRLVVRGEGKEPTEEAYQTAITSMAGLQSFEDFFLVLRYLTFFFEERQPIVWDPSAQSDILRVLFFEPQKVTRVREFFDRIQKLDSRRRTIRAVHNKLVNSLTKARAALSTQPEVSARAQALQTQASALQERRSELVTLLELTDQERHDARLRVETTKLQVETLRSEYAAYEHVHLLHLFPRAADVAQYVFLRRDTGCLVCGNRDPDASHHIDQCAAQHVCPACHRIVESEPGVVSSGEVNRARMEDLDRKISEALAALEARQQSFTHAKLEHDSLVKELRTVRSTLDEVGRQLSAIRAQLPPTAEELGAWESEAAALQRDMDALRAEQSGYEEEFGELLNEGERIVSAVSEQVVERFTRFAGEFLADRCDLQYQTEMRKIGQEGVRFPFPRFTVRMSSAAMGGEKSPRYQPSEVSESQREFIDLAFRMALMDVAAEGRPAMLLLETPEASLDALFVERAGGLLGDFALANEGNRLFATSNLTGGEMIPSLLGALPRPDGEFPQHHVVPADREVHVINLLELAAPNNAIQEAGEEYLRQFQRAVYPEEFRS